MGAGDATRERVVGLLAVFVDQLGAGRVSSDRLAVPILDELGIVGCALFERPVGSVGVVVRDVIA